MAASKRYVASLATVDRNKSYALAEAMAILKSWKAAKFDESVDIALNLGVDPKHA